jgi:hypothetical protein
VLKKMRIAEGIQIDEISSGQQQREEMDGLFNLFAGRYEQ